MVDFGETALATTSLSTSAKAIIRVFDESRNARKDFHCHTALLLREMSYFSRYILNRISDNCVEIDVHCDLEVFEWLMAFISRKRPKLEPRTVISILVSSNFLQMARLEEISLKYLHNHFQEVVQAPLDFSCISEALVEKLAKLFTIDHLATLSDPDNKLLDQLYFMHLCNVLSTEKAKFWRCKLCQSLYVQSHENRLRCNKTPIKINFWGQGHASHERDPTFDINVYLATQHLQHTSWKDLYWRIWSTLNHSCCRNCRTFYPLALHATCPTHPEGVSISKTHYTCCSSPTLPIPVHPTGCQNTEHNPDEQSKTSSADKTFLRHKKEIDTAWRREGTSSPGETLSPLAVQCGMYIWSPEECRVQSTLIMNDRTKHQQNRKLTLTQQREEDATIMNALIQQIVESRASQLSYNSA
ncbi:hypothetical protein BC832DRAFT_615246 [Gaertneriomyces semiglobifer]|nr:hypothetical protein BC832DRAFT_615246 [Gaertneriomyces semiglobifer]